MAAKPLRPEPMNVTTNHPKVKLNLTLASPLFVAGDYICGKMEMDCRADKGLGIGSMIIELFAFQELHSRDHSATSNFIHLRRFFQGPGLPPSNAVQAHPQPGDPPLPPQYYQARRGHSTFLFRLPLPHTSPASISFGSGLATVRYEIRASVSVSWKGERRVVTEKKEVEVVEAFDERLMALTVPGKEPEAVAVGENGKIWMQGRIIGGLVVAGETACVELQVKNHTNKKNTGLYVAVTRVLDLPEASVNNKTPPLELTDTLTTVPFKGPEYIIPPGAEGVASLVFDVPRSAKGVKGGILLGDVVENMPKDDEGKKVKESESIFEIRCIVGVKMTMGLGSKDILVEIPVHVVHPAALPEAPPIDEPQPYPYLQPGYPSQDPYYNLYPHPSQTPGPYPVQHQHYAHPTHTGTPSLYHPPQPPPHHVYANIPPERVHSPYEQQAYPPLSMSPPLGAGVVNGVYVDPGTNMVWLPPPSGYDANGYEYGGEYQGEYYVPPIPTFQNLHQDPYAYDQPQPGYTSPSLPAPPIPPPRSSSAGAYNQVTGTGLLSPHLPPNSGVPGLPPTSTTPGLSALGFGAPLSSASHRDPNFNYDHNHGQGHGHGDVYGHGGVNLSRRPSGRARSVSPQRSPSRLQAQSQNQGHTMEQRASPSPRMASHALPMPPPTTTIAHGSAPLPKLDLANVAPNPADALSGANSSPNINGNGTSTTPLHSPRPWLSPKQSFTRVTTITPVPTSGSGTGSLSPGGAMSPGTEYFNLGLETKEISKSERVEELERMADEVARKKKDLSGDLPRDSVLGLGERNKEDDKTQARESINKTLPAPPVPTVSDKDRFEWRKSSASANTRARVDEYFADSGTKSTTVSRPRLGQDIDGDSTPPTPATPTLTAVRAKSKSKSDTPRALLSPTLGSGLGGLGGLGKRESGLDALEAKLLAEVGTRKPPPEKKPDVWSVLGSDQGQGKGKGLGEGQSQTQGQNHNQRIPTPKTEKPSPISIPPMKRRDSDVDPSLNDSAISSLTLPDCGDVKDDKDLKDLRNGGRGYGDEWAVNVNGALKGLEGDEDDGEGEKEERERDSDEKSQKTHKGRSSKNKSDSEGKSDRKAVKKRISREKGKGKAAAAKGRVAAWLGNVEADVPPAEDVIAPSPSPDIVDDGKMEGLPSTSSVGARPDAGAGAGAGAGEEELSVEELLKKEQEELDKADPPKPGQSSPNPRSSGFVPIGTLKRDIYQRSLVPKDSPLASTNNPVEDAKRITDLWSVTNNKAKGAAPTLKTNKDVSPPSSPPNKLGNGTVANNPWQSVRSPWLAGRKVSGGKLPMFPPPVQDREPKYDIRSARGGKGGKVTAVAAIWASGANAKEADQKVEKGKEEVPKAKKLSLPTSKLAMSASSSSSSSSDVTGTGVNSGVLTNGANKRVGAGLGASKRPIVKSAPIPAPTIISSSHAKPTLSSTASLARPSGQLSPGKKLPAKVPLTTISELPSEGSKTKNSRASFAGVGSGNSMSEGVKAAEVSGVNKGSAAAGLKALSGSDAKSGPSASKRNSTPASTTSPTTSELAFGQARLRDLIKKYQGQGQAGG